MKINFCFTRRRGLYIRVSKTAKQLNKVVENYHEIVSESK